MFSVKNWPLPMIRFHRALLIAATVGVAIAASRIATNTSEAGGWLLTAAFALILFVADLSREVEETAASLADSSGKERDGARRDVYLARHPWSLPIALAIAVVLFAASAVAYAWQHGN